VSVDTNGADFDVKAETIEEDLSARKQPMRLGINLGKPVTQASIRVIIQATKGN